MSTTEMQRAPAVIKGPPAERSACGRACMGSGLSHRSEEAFASAELLRRR